MAVTARITGNIFAAHDRWREHRVGLQGARPLPAGGMEPRMLAQASSLPSWDARGAASGTAVVQCTPTHC